MQNPLSFFGLYVSRAGNVGFPIGKRMAPPGETYGSVRETYTTHRNSTKKTKGIDEQKTFIRRTC